MDSFFLSLDSSKRGRDAVLDSASLEVRFFSILDDHIQKIGTQALSMLVEGQ